MRDIDDILPYAMPYAPRAPEPLVLRSIRDAARQLCSAARFWREDDSFTIAKPESVGLCTISDALIIGIEAAALDEFPLLPKTVGWLDRNEPGWSSYLEQEGGARYVTQLTPLSVTVVPKSSGHLTIRYVLQPSLEAMTLPDFLVEAHADALGKAAAGYVLTTPDADFANPQLGAAFLTGFAAYCNTAKWMAAKGQQNAPQRVKGRYF